MLTCFNCTWVNRKLTLLNFSEFNFTDSLLEGLDAMNFKQPTPIQEQAIPLVLEGKDMIACAQTGTGKTAAFLLPIIDKISAAQSHGTLNTLIIVPTRELATQIDQQVEAFSYFTNVGSFAVYGGGTGEEFDYEKRALTKGTEIIIATPGRLLSHINLGYVKFDTIQHLILDEADRMLDMGFNDDIMKIINKLPKTRQSLLFSATFPKKIRTLAEKILKDPLQVNIAISKPNESIVQRVIMTHDNQKVGVVKDIFKEKVLQSVIVFCSRKKDVDVLARELRKQNLKAYGMHSDLEQNKREEVLRDFKNRNFNILVATDIMSRGIDIDAIDMVINYDVPGDPEDYVHRIGRTGRAEASGIAITFVNTDDQYKFARIEKLVEKSYEKEQPPVELGPGPEYKENSKKPHGGGNFKGKKRFNKNRNGGNRNNSGNRN